MNIEKKTFPKMKQLRQKNLKKLKKQYDQVSYLIIRVIRKYLHPSHSSDIDDQGHLIDGNFEDLSQDNVLEKENLNI